MKRTTTYKLRYTATIVVLVGVVILFLSLVGWSVPALIGACVMLLIPGRVQGHYYRDLFNGRRALEAGDIDASIFHTEQFLAAVRERPGLKSLIWLGGVIYTADPEAMALNNLGAAHMEAGRLGVAESTFNDALRLDPLYPIPLTNLAVLGEVAGDRAEAERYLREAEDRGYTGGSLDRVIQQSGALLAKVEGGRPKTV
ncbi:MAG: hypothetical protein AAF170_16925 [Bacteroidota bacterium]